MQKKLFIVVNVDSFFLSHRREIASAAVAQGYDVTVIARDTGHKNKIFSLGVKHIDLPIDRADMNIRKEWQLCKFLTNLYRKEKPDIIHHVGLKIILWGTIASVRAGCRNVVNAVSGLGIMFSEGRVSLIAKSILITLRLYCRKINIITIFQNKDDYDLFRSYGIVSDENSVIIPGSGVDLDKYLYSPEQKEDKLHIIFTARMLEEKGVYDLIKAAEILREKYARKIRFILCGGIDPNPKGITKEYLTDSCDGDYICWLGHRTDIDRLLRSSHIVAFPSYYREGIPKSLIEAAAAGKPIVTCDSVGCRDAVVHGVTGLLVPAKSPEALAKSLEILIDDDKKRHAMGKEARLLAEQKFSLTAVIEEHLNIYSSFAES
ncbi:MAG: glycosyltransferase family 4 protein [Rikenellaceae bacterium]|nr:glycosyltransferase family 4 protein [Rikenellaceae bacterium]